MKTFRCFTTLLFASFFLIAGLQAQQNSCYVRLEDASGYTPTSEQLAELEAAACALIDSFPVEFRDSFRVYDFGFYLHQEVTEGGYPEPFAQKIQEVQALTPYYLLFGKQTDRSGVYTKFWIEVKFPASGEFECLDLISPLVRDDLIKKFSIIANQSHENYKKNYFKHLDVEVDVMDSVKNYIISMFNCCDVANKGNSGCSSCVFSEAQFARKIIEDFGFQEQACSILKKANNQIQNESQIFNRIVSEDGNDIDIDEEIQDLISEFYLDNPGLSTTIFKFKYPDNCINFESLWNEYYNDSSDTKMIIGLIGSIGKEGKILWQTDGIAPFHKDFRDIGYTVTKKQYEKGYDIKITLKLKVINISSDVTVNPQSLRDAIVSKQPFNGDFMLNIRNQWVNCTGITFLNCTGVINSSGLNPTDHIIAIVDNIPEGAHSAFNPAGLAQKISGSVACVEKKYITDPAVSLHEIGHLLGLRDAYDAKSDSPTLMGKYKKPPNYTISISDKRDLYGPFIFQSKK